MDRLFDKQSTTEDIYQHVASGLAPFAWNGGVGTLFAYGQTGSGKTYTVSQIEKLVAHSLMEGGLEGQRELYMTIVDLAGNSAFDLLNAREPISVLEDADGVTQLSGAKEHSIKHQDEMLDLIERAASFRRTASTFKNDASSRSHGICRIRIANPATDSDGFLYLVDLAGSEAARDVAVHGADRMRETREINISLSVLKDCIRGKVESDALQSAGSKAKTAKMPRIPFRQSTLTKVLKHVFDPASSSACKTVVIACVNPSLADVGPSKNTLRYAEMLRVQTPSPASSAPGSRDPSRAPKRHDAAWAAQMKKAESQLSQLGFSTGTGSSSWASSGDESTLPFKQRICPGMAVSWRLPHDVAASSILAIILCPFDSVSSAVSDARKVVNLVDKVENGGQDDGGDAGASYLCALATPGQAKDSYEVNLDRQAIIGADMMESEVVLQYDGKARHYVVRS